MQPAKPNLDSIANALEKEAIFSAWEEMREMHAQGMDLVLMNRNKNTYIIGFKEDIEDVKKILTKYKIEKMLDQRHQDWDFQPIRAGILLFSLKIIWAGEELILKCRGVQIKKIIDRELRKKCEGMAYPLMSQFLTNAELKFYKNGSSLAGFISKSKNFYDEIEAGYEYLTKERNTDVLSEYLAQWRAAQEKKQIDTAISHKKIMSRAQKL